MKNILIICVLVLFTACDSPAQSDGNPAKTRALELRGALDSISKTGDSSQASWDATRTAIDNYQKEFGVSAATTNNIFLLRKFELSVARKFPDPARYKALLEQLAADPLLAVAELAGQQLAVQKRLEDLKSRPVDLQFTALDGTLVDLATMRGKVVLIDFWAMWCPDCIVSEPNVVATYKKYHAQGFEILGISLDEDKAALLAFAKQNGMVWPQYFDGKKWDNKISRDFGIRSIPAMWLVDKKGFLASTHGGEDLAGQVEKLLKAP